MSRWNEMIARGMSQPSAILGVLNVSPESFHAGSVATEESEIARRAEAMQRDGADAIDIGAAGSAPYKDTAIDEDEECRRMERAVRIVRRVSTLPISADTPRPRVAHAALAAGADAINCIRGLRFHTEPLPLGTGVIVMAHGDDWIPRDGEDPQAAVCRILRRAKDRAIELGADSVTVDPGIGFFRNRQRPWHEWDLALVRSARRLHEDSGRAVCFGVSRKSFIGHLLGGIPPEDRLAGTLAVHAALSLAGTALLRVHDVREAAHSIRMLRAIGTLEDVERTKLS